MCEYQVVGGRWGPPRRLPIKIIVQDVVLSSNGNITDIKHIPNARDLYEFKNVFLIMTQRERYHCPHFTLKKWRLTEVK